MSSRPRAQRSSSPVYQARRSTAVTRRPHRGHSISVFDVREGVHAIGATVAELKARYQEEISKDLPRKGGSGAKGAWLKSDWENALDGSGGQSTALKNGDKVQHTTSKRTGKINRATEKMYYVDWDDGKPTTRVLKTTVEASTPSTPSTSTSSTRSTTPSTSSSWWPSSPPASTTFWTTSTQWTRTALERMSRREIQDLAKAKNIRANLTTAVIINQLLETAGKVASTSTASTGPGVGRTAASAVWGGTTALLGGVQNVTLWGLGKTLGSSSESSKDQTWCDANPNLCFCYKHKGLCTAGTLGLLTMGVVAAGGVALGSALAIGQVAMFVEAYGAYLLAGVFLVSVLGTTVLLLLRQQSKVRLREAELLAEGRRKKWRRWGTVVTEDLKQKKWQDDLTAVQGQLEQLRGKANAVCRTNCLKLLKEFNRKNSEVWHLSTTTGAQMVIDQDLDATDQPTPNDPLALRLKRTKGTSYAALGVDGEGLLTAVTWLVDEATTAYTTEVTRYTGLVEKAEHMNESGKYGHLSVQTIDSLSASGKPIHRSALAGLGDTLKAAVEASLKGRTGTVETLARISHRMGTRLKEMRARKTKRLEIDTTLTELTQKTKQRLQRLENERDSSQRTGVPFLPRQEEQLATVAELSLYLSVVETHFPFVSGSYTSADLTANLRHLAEAGNDRFGGMKAWAAQVVEHSDES